MMIQKNKKPILKIFLIRHEKPFYKDIGHDLTNEGVDNARKLGKQIFEKRIVGGSKNTILFHSPKPRAWGTSKFIQEGAKISIIKEEDFLRMISEN